MTDQPRRPRGFPRPLAPLRKVVTRSRTHDLLECDHALQARHESDDKDEMRRAIYKHRRCQACREEGEK